MFKKKDLHVLVHDKTSYLLVYERCISVFRMALQDTDARAYHYARAMDIFVICTKDEVRAVGDESRFFDILIRTYILYFRRFASSVLSSVGLTECTNTIRL